MNYRISHTTTYAYRDAVSPGTFFGPAGEGYLRLALVPTEEECRRAAAILERAL